MKKEKTIKPINGRVLIRVHDKETETEGGIALPVTYRGRADRGTVEAVGRGRVTKKGALQEPEVAPGDVVVFDPYSVKWHDKLDDLSAGSHHAKGGQLALIEESDILLVLE